MPEGHEYNRNISSNNQSFEQPKVLPSFHLEKLNIKGKNDIQSCK